MKEQRYRPRFDPDSSADARESCVRASIKALRDARDLLIEAGALKAAAKTRAALRSADGARRNARGVKPSRRKQYLIRRKS